MILFSMFGAIIFISKIIMEGIPNVHPVTMFVITLTIVYRAKALIPIYIYVLLNGIYCGFAMWWIPYTYIWAIYWAITMTLPHNIPNNVKVFLYPVMCGLFGLMFGTLYAPAQAIMYFGGSFSAIIKWIIAGLPWDALHAVGNFFMGLLIYPLSELLLKLQNKYLA